jgi:hypothetical protein
VSHWKKRTIEEQRLLNPSFCSILLWHSSVGHAAVSQSRVGIAFEECFLVLPMVLHREIRESLPHGISTSLAVWITNHPLAPATITDRARTLVPFTKEAMRFAGAYGVLKFERTTVQANPDWKKRMAASMADCSEEVHSCAKRAEFIGKWFAKTGSPETVMSLIGVQP